MKKLVLLTLFAALFSTAATFAQVDKSKRVSPPALAKETTKSGVTISIDYSRPSLKGRAIGSDFVPFGKVWRTGANEATVFEVDKDVKIEGQTLPAGKYGLYSIPGENEWVIIFSKKWNQWGTQYKESEDQLRVSVKPETSSKQVEQLSFEISKSGQVDLLWGNTKVPFKVTKK